MTYSLDTSVRNIAGFRRLEIMAEGSLDEDGRCQFTGIHLHHYKSDTVVDFSTLSKEEQEHVEDALLDAMVDVL